MTNPVIDIEGVIGWEVTASDVKRQLRDIGDAEEIDVNIGSVGGYIDDGMNIYTALKNSPAKINVHITNGYSMGSVIPMAGDTVTIEPTGMLMIHKPSNIVWGTADDMRKEAGTLDKYESRLVKAYQSRDLNLDDEQLSEAIADETWYTAEEALEAGFVDAISEGQAEAPQSPSNAAFEWLRVAKYKNTPESLAKFTRTNRAKSGEQIKKLITTKDGSAVDNTPTKGTPMTEEVKTVSEADIEARVKAAVDANDQKWKTMITNENATIDSIQAAVDMGLDAEQAEKLMARDAAARAASADAEKDADTDDKGEKEPESNQMTQFMAQFNSFMENSDVNKANKQASTGGDEGEKKKPFDAKTELKAIKGGV